MTPDEFDAWLTELVQTLMNPPPRALETRRAAAEMNRMVHELLSDPAVPWPSELAGPQWR